MDPYIHCQLILVQLINILVKHSIQLEANSLKKRIKKTKINNLQDYVINSIGEDLYEAFYKNYSLKQWEVDPKETSAVYS